VTPPRSNVSSKVVEARREVTRTKRLGAANPAARKPVRERRCRSRTRMPSVDPPTLEVVVWSRNGAGSDVHVSALRRGITAGCPVESPDEFPDGDRERARLRGRVGAYNVERQMGQPCPRSRLTWAASRHTWCTRRFKGRCRPCRRAAREARRFRASATRRWGGRPRATQPAAPQRSCGLPEGGSARKIGCEARSACGVASRIDPRRRSAISAAATRVMGSRLGLTTPARRRRWTFTGISAG